MDRERIREFARNFHENGLKLLLENPKNLRDLLMLVSRDIAERIDLDRVRLVKETFVRRDCRAVHTDIVLTAPLRGEPNGGKRVWVYILIEHQSEPDRMMPLRLLDYVVQIYRYQEREWKRNHRSTAGLRLQPVLPIVLYTGDRRWDAVGTLADLVQPGAASFQNWMPRLESFFLNTPAIPTEVFRAVGGFLGPVLRLTTTKRARLGAFRKQLVSVLQFLEAMPAEERYRWLELLSYIHALVYHVRQPEERPGLWREIEASVATDPHREEVSDVRRTIA
ncbi:MAG: Rpn family recombination-promoting nuclease/putative transposase, partial [Planctomycetes bacterium]|nr:Rpn family recombination-promoting nuclease/putative transposase [Planctomycetota bacterium]